MRREWHSGPFAAIERLPGESSRSELLLDLGEKGVYSSYTREILILGATLGLNDFA